MENWTNEEREERLARDRERKRKARRDQRGAGNLTDVEEILIGQVFPVISVYTLPGGQYAYRANIINFPQRCAGVRGTTST
ncbi:hypothetical protein RhiirA4_549391 [Rhizophagus irregularis]|uniref:DUF6570 domain-containing protein n=1 Tax=Rhizophagus irregularis TaxID=588596 RepID=A0A2I1HD37_9GLOM|nr:hypothetical protein RhiirA4_549391 [Rhizophagus irregularis]